MSGYNGRHGPNVSEYLRNLNAINPEPATEENLNMEQELALFTNTNFFDFETGQNTDFQAQPGKADETTPSGTSTSEAMTPAQSVMGDLSQLDFMAGDFNFTDFNAYPSASLNGFPEGAQNFQPLPAANAAPVYHPNPQQQAPQPQQFTQPTPQAAEKRKPDNPNGPGNRPLSQEEAARIAAEDEKRKRNTAASARFRVKKKQREAALEQSAKEMSDKVSSLESKVSQLEMENKWLKNLLVDKNEGNDEIVSLWKDFAAKHANEAESKPEKAKEAASS